MYNPLSPPITNYYSYSYPVMTPLPQTHIQKLVYNKSYDYDFKDQPKYSDSYRHQYNQLNDQDLRLIAYALQEEISYRKELMNLSKDLQDLNPHLVQLFQMFTLDEIYKLEKFRFVEIVQSYQEVKVCDVDLLFSYLNGWKQAQSLTYSQFGSMISKYGPIPEIQELKLRLDHPPQKQIAYLMRIISMNLQMLSALEYMRQRLDKSLCNMVQVFEFIDQDKDGWIKPFEIVKFLQNFQIFVTFEEASLVLRDIDEQQQLDLKTFINYYKRKSQAVYL